MNFYLLLPMIGMVYTYTLAVPFRDANVAEEVFPTGTCPLSMLTRFLLMTYVAGSLVLVVFLARKIMTPPDKCD